MSNAVTRPSEEMGGAERKLRALVAHAGYSTMRAFARAAGVDRSVLVTGIRGRTTPQPKTMVRAARLLGVSTEMLDRLFAEARGTKASAE